MTLLFPTNSNSGLEEVRFRGIFSADMNFVIQMTQAANHQRDKIMASFVNKGQVKWYYVKWNGNSWITGMHTKQLVASKASARDKRIEATY